MLGLQGPVYNFVLMYFLNKIKCTESPKINCFNIDKAYLTENYFPIVN